MDAQTLLREAIGAYQQQDSERARELLQASLKLDPQNESAWLWLARTYTDIPGRQLYCVNRVLKINPKNDLALALQSKLMARMPDKAPVRRDSPAPDADQQRIQILNNRAADCEAAGDLDGALEYWVQVLEIQPDHPEAIQKAVKMLVKDGYKADALDLIMEAARCNTPYPAIYSTGIDLATRIHEYAAAESLMEKLSRLPNAEDGLIARTVQYFIDEGQPQRALDLLRESIEERPNSQPLLLHMARLQQSMGRKQEASLYFDRAARAKGWSKGMRQADAALSDVVPILTDHERGSTLLALREALGIGLMFLFFAWQDAGLMLAQIGSGRISGIGLSILGGYLLITATSSPQQKPLAGLLGGAVPANPGRSLRGMDAEDFKQRIQAGAVADETHLPVLPIFSRLLFALAGVLLLGLAFTLVFSRSLPLLSHPQPVSMP